MCLFIICDVSVEWLVVVSFLCLNLLNGLFWRGGRRAARVSSYQRHWRRGWSMQCYDSAINVEQLVCQVQFSTVWQRLREKWQFHSHLNDVSVSFRIWSSDTRTFCRHTAELLITLQRGADEDERLCCRGQGKQMYNWALNGRGVEEKKMISACDMENVPWDTFRLNLHRTDGRTGIRERERGEEFLVVFSLD